MFSVLVTASAMLAACELQPAPHKAPPAEPTPPPVKDPTAAAQPTPPPANPPPANPPPTPPSAVDAGVVAPPPDAPIKTTQECTDVAAKIADALINEATDPTQKAAMEQEKTKMILRTAEVCTRNAWKPEARSCFLKATTTAQMQDCAQQLGPQQQ
jgi:hypothetical protein